MEGLPIRWTCGDKDVRAAGFEPARPLRDNGFSCHFGFRRLLPLRAGASSWSGLCLHPRGMLPVESLHVRRRALGLRFGVSLGVASPREWLFARQGVHRV